jgi:hypothetical protein
MMALFSTRFRRGLALAAALILLPAASRAQVIVNEILAANGGTTAPLAEIPDYFPEYIELYNSGTADIDLGAEGWTITDNPILTNKYQFPQGTILYADSFLLLFCDNETNFPGIHVGFSLDGKTGETITLYRRSGANHVRAAQTKFGIQLSGYSVGRVPGANSSSEFSLNFPTPCGGTVPCLANAKAPFLSAPFTSNTFSLKINEWLATNSAGHKKDWLELYNPDPTNIIALDNLVIWDKDVNIWAPVVDDEERTGPTPLKPLSYLGPLGYVQIFCSGDAIEDANNLNFGISSTRAPVNGILETLTLYNPDRTKLTSIDAVNSTLFHAQNISEGRVPDGSSRIGIFPNPTPGEANFGPIPEIIINEVLSHTDLPLEDAVEFYNPTTNAVNMGYWWMSNRRNTPKMYQFPNPTIVPPLGYYVIYEKDFNNTNLLGPRAFTFNSAHGDECYIFKADASGELLGYRKGVQFGAAPNGYSFGRYVTSDTNAEFVLMSDLSLGTGVRAGMPENLISLFRQGTGAPNPPVRMSPVVINEIHFHPVGKLGITDTNDNSEDEFIELRNTASTNVALYYQAQVNLGENSDSLTNRWKIRGNVDYEFPKTSLPTIPAGGYILVVNFDPFAVTNQEFTASWRARMGIDPGTALYGPYKGKLSNREGNVELYRPDTPQVRPHPDAGFTPQILVDRVHYEDRAPWPSNSVDGTVWADGGGGSLQRRFSYEFPNDPTNWFVAQPTPGRYNSRNHLELPYFVVSPRDFIDVPPRTNLLLSVVVRGSETPGSGQISLQWYRNGVPIQNATGPNHPINNVGVANIGQYYVVARNQAGSSTSRVATISIACPYLLSRVGTAFGQFGGDGSVTVTSPEGCPWEVTGIPAWVTVTSETSFDGTGTFAFTVGPHSGTAVRSAILMVAGQSFKISQSPPDSTPPRVAFVAPSSGARVTTPVTTIRGTASDNFDIQRVEVQTGSNPYIPAAGTRAWTNVTTLQPGTNWIRVRSIDLSGNISATNTRSIIYVVTSPVNLATNNFGWGTVSGATNQQRLELARGYTLTAVARPGFVFSNWTGDIPTTYTPKLQFMMEPNMSIAANFVPNPFIPIKGTYYGNFSAWEATYHTNSGSFKLTVTDRGTYSASFSVGGKKYSTSGQFDLLGKATNVVNRTGLAPLTVGWSLSLSTGPFNHGLVDGSVGATDWAAPAALYGALAVYNATTNKAPYAGKYTLILEGLPEDPGYPQGDGYGTVTINTAGTIKFAGVLADGVKVTQSVPISRYGTWYHHAVLYGGRGSTLSSIGFQSDEFKDVEGFLDWVRPSGPSPKYYTNGFIYPRAHLLGSKYVAPVGTASRILNLTEAQLVLSGGNLPVSPSINNVVLGLGSKVTNASPNTLTCTFTPTTGLFSGSYKEAGTTLSIPFRGAVLQHPFLNRASGYFLGTTESGRVSFEARP